MLNCKQKMMLRITNMGEIQTWFHLVYVIIAYYSQDSQTIKQNECSILTSLLNKQFLVSGLQYSYIQYDILV